MANKFFTGLGVGLSLLAMSAPALAVTCAVPAEIDLLDFDTNRIAKFASARNDSIKAAITVATAAEKKLITSIVGAATVPVSEIPMGLYKCRTLKLGGDLPFSAYPYFDCFVSEMSTQIEKLTGSQRFLGTIHDNEDGAVFYKGAISYQTDDMGFWYGENAERDQVGCIYQIAGKSPRYRLELPLPLYESTFDVIELVPQD